MDNLTNERLEKLEAELKLSIQFSEYIATELEKTTKYSEYLAETLDNVLVVLKEKHNIDINVADINIDTNG